MTTTRVSAVTDALSNTVHAAHDSADNITAQWGAAYPAAALNLFRFSSEALDATLGFVHYAYRPYNPLAGRFTNRDPIGEQGGLNRYGFVGNDPVDKTDCLGYCECGISGFKMTNHGWTKDRDNKIVAQQSLRMKVSGTWPAPKYSP